MKTFLRRFVFILFLIFALFFCELNPYISYGLTNKNTFSETINHSNNEPNILSKNVVVLDRKTKTILFEKECHTKVPMASTTKIMTCIIALENSSPNEIVTISQKAASIHGSTLGITTNSKITITDLLYGLMLRSGNDCAIAIAEHIAGSVENFANLMNKKSIELGLKNTNFITPHGLDSESHFTTAYELAILTDYALKNTSFRKIVSAKTAIISVNNQTRTISNTNELLENLEGVYGVKTGFTFNAGRCLVSSCKRDNLDIIVVVLGADTKKMRTTDSINLIEYVFKTFKYTDISSFIKNNFENYLQYFDTIYILEKTSTKPILKLKTTSPLEYPLHLDRIPNLKTKIYTLNVFNPDIKSNTKVGVLQVYNDKNLIYHVDILLENTLIKNDWKYYFKTIFSKF